MKRSEAVDIIFEWFRDPDILYWSQELQNGNNEAISALKNCASICLQHLEEEGILPPHLNKYEYGDKIPLYANDYIGYDFIWEPEDEKK